MEASLRDKTTIPLHFQPRLVEMRIDRATIDEEFAKMADSLDKDFTEFLCLTTAIDRILQLILTCRFPEVKLALRNALMKQQLHKDNELFDKAYNYIREYY